MNPLLINPPSLIQTERLLLRSYQIGDESWYYSMSQRNKSHLARYESDNPVMKINSEEDAEMVIHGFVDSWSAHKAFFMGGFQKDTLEFVAQIYIGVVNWALPEFEVGYFADANQSGKGYVTEAAKGAIRFIFEHLGAHRIRLECDDTNERSFRVAERCGMIREGHMRENHRHADGSITGTLHYGLLRSEYISTSEEI